MARNLQDFLDEPPFGLIIAGALGLIVTVFAFVGFRNLRSGDKVDASAAITTTSVVDAGDTVPESPTAFVFTPASPDGVACNGLAQQAGVISGAEPGETLLFNSSSADELPAGFADSTGSYPVEWSCTASDIGTTWRMQAVGQKSGGRVDLLITGAAENASSEFRTTSITDPFPCDGEVHNVAVLVGAQSNEEITFVSPQSSSLRPGTADESGQLKMNWSCEPSQANKTWTVTATGSDSGQTTEINFSGSVVPGAATSSTTTTPKTTTTAKQTTTATSATSSTATTEGSSTTISAAELVVQVSEDPFACNGTSRQFASVKNFTPSEVVTFAVSPANDPVRQGKADENGQLLIRWKCDEADAGTEWNLTATGSSSGKSVTFSFAGGPPGSTSGGTTTGGDAGSDSGSDSGTSDQLSFSVIENPFVCDGEARPVATLSKLDPQEVVKFSASDGTSFRNGVADTRGVLTVRWQCDQDEVRTWNLTATGQSSGKTIDFSILGSAAANNS